MSEHEFGKTKTCPKICLVQQSYAFCTIMFWARLWARLRARLRERLRERFWARFWARVWALRRVSRGRVCGRFWASPLGASLGVWLVELHGPCRHVTQPT